MQSHNETNNKILNITKKVRPLEPLLKSKLFILIAKNNNIPAFVELISDPRVEKNPLVVEKNIEIKSGENLPIFDTSGKALIIEKNNLPFQISDDDIQKIANQIISMIRNPIFLAEALKDLDNELGNAMQENNIQFDDSDLPEFIITGQTHYIPGPPPEKYHPRKKARLLDTILLKRENENGINMEGYSPKFSGFVDHNEANPFVASGHLFTEDKQVSRLLLHGSYSHRIAFEAIRFAIKSGKLDLKYGDEKELNMLQVIQLFVYTNFYYETGYQYLAKISHSLWALLVDRISDSTHIAKDDKYDYYSDPDHYSFSSCSPFVLNSILLCFGKELGLPNLQFYLLDSHYKASYKMVYRIKNSTPTIQLSDSAIYDYCMQALTISPQHFNPGEVSVKLPFTLSKSSAQGNPQYQRFYKYGSEGIVKKINTITSSGQYDSWANFYSHLNQTNKNSDTQPKVQRFTNK